MRSFVCFCVFWQLQEILDESTDLKDFALQELPILPVCSLALLYRQVKKKKKSISPHGSCMVTKSPAGLCCIPTAQYRLMCGQSKKISLQEKLVQTRACSEMALFVAFTWRATRASMSEKQGPEHITEMGNQGNHTLGGCRQQLR